MTSSHIKDSIYIVAEIGCNHQGDIKIALRMIEEAAKAGASAVKFQKRENKILFSDDLYNQTYDNSNSYGMTYGEHREKLELSNENFIELKKCAAYNKIDYQITPFDLESLEFCKKIDFDSYKIASADIHFHQLIHEVCKTQKPVFISSGGALEYQIKDAVNIITSYSIKPTLYHCTAAYPAPLQDMNLSYIPRLIEAYHSSAFIGLSDHENGIDAATIAYMLGARSFEKHFTLDRSLKGTDQSFSLEPQGLTKMIRNLNRINLMMGSGVKEIYESESKPLAKMIKTIHYNKDLAKGHVISSSDLIFKVSLQKNYLPSDAFQLYDKKIIVDVKQGDLVLTDHFEL